MSLVFALGATIWAFWPVLETLNVRWSTDPQYSHAYLAPFAVALVSWIRRGSFPKTEVSPSWLGVAILVVAAAVRFAGDWYALGFLDGVAFVLAITGLVPLLYGRAVFRWALPGLILLWFMAPPPYKVHAAMAAPLQRIAANGTVYALQTAGRPAVAEGQTIILTGRSLNVVDECCGLGMIFVFFFLACVVAAISTRPLFDRLALIVAAPAIGVTCNILRIAAAAEAAAIGGPELQKQVHDIGGWLMAPIAIAMNFMLLALLGFLFPPVQKAEEEPLSLAFQLAGSESPASGIKTKGARK
ncbi:MAG TPA: exosortase/archaeosortase family protein [Planctomycetia bacterium]|nr:exosortase/archaeosortase family protein [Planctomycetia bacterium]